MSTDMHPTEPPADQPRLHALPPPVDEDMPYDPYYDGTPQQRRGTPPPHDRAAEQAVLTSLLADPQAHTRITGILRPTDFYQPVHETIWNTYHQLLEQLGTAPDRVILAKHLLQTRQNEALRTLADLRADEAQPQLVEYHAVIVRDAARRRTLQNTATRLQQIAETASVEDIHPALLDGLDTLEEAFRRDAPNQQATGTGRHDLSWVINGQAPTQPPPVYTTRTDGHALFYPGKVNGVFGDPESGKTWLAQTAIVEALNAGGTAAMIDVDHNGPNHTSARLLLLGARPDHISDPDRFRYYEPEDNEELLAAVDEITRWRPNVYVLDSLGEVLPMMGVKSVDNDEITAALRRTCTPPSVQGSCVITIDHLPKGTDARQSGYAIGGTAKKRMMRGSYLRVEVAVQPAPGSIGRSNIRIEKDTIGELRRATPGGFAGTLVLDSTTPGLTEWRVELSTAPLDRTTHAKRYTQVMERVSRFVEDNDQATFGDIKRALGGNDDIRRKAIDTLIAEGYMSKLPGTRGSFLHHSNTHYREAEDDHLNHTD